VTYTIAVNIPQWATSDPRSILFTPGLSRIHWH